MNNGSTTIDAAKADKLLAAKRKLREYESRRMNGDTSPVPSSNSEVMNGRTSALSVPHGGYDDHDGMAQQLESKTNECESLKKQIFELHGLYTQVHSAYNELVSKNANGHSPGGEQIVQLQSALSLLVEEKTDLLSRLRSEVDKVNRLEMELQQSNYSSHSSKEENRLRDELIHAEKMVAAHLNELNNLRKENANAQSITRSLQQDKAEAQARLRGLYKEKDELEMEVKEIRKEISMKEMYIRQLNAHHSNGTSPITVLPEDEVRNELERLKEEFDRYRRDSIDSIQMYTVREKDLSERNAVLIRERDSINHELNILRMNISQLEDDLHGSKSEMDRLNQLIINMKNGNDDMNKVVNGISEEESIRRIDETAKRITIAFEERLLSEGDIYRRNIDDKNREIDEKNGEIDELILKLQLAEKRMKEDEEHARSIQSIMEELQNEKATVSRALSQNRELKEQVIELEDRLVSLTQEKMDIELSRQALEYELKKKNEMNGDDNEGIDRDGEETNHIDTSYREQELESQLGMANRQLEEVRLELRRSQNQNDSMNAIMQQNGEDENQNSIVVELSQAVGRVSILTEENNTLRRQLESIMERGGDDRINVLETQLRNIQEENERLRNIDRREDGDEHQHERTAILEERLREAEDMAVRVMREGAERITVLEEKIIESERERLSIEAKLIEKESTSTDDIIKKLEEELKVERDERNRLEHIRIALENENETITDHVVLYQHYRKVMRDRLRAKDEELRNAEIERERIANTCHNLHNTLTKMIQSHHNEQSSSSIVNGSEGSIVEDGEISDIDKQIDVDNPYMAKICELMEDIKKVPTSRGCNSIPKCTQCIGNTIVV